MKILNSSERRKHSSLRFPTSGKHVGFALVVTLILMVLLSILAIGMLSLSTVALRSTAASDSRAIAQANARMAMLLAMGQLQRSAGLDTRVTAKADVLGLGGKNPNLTGVWESWELKATKPPQPSEFERTAKNDKFVNWLVSNSDPTQVQDATFGATGDLISPVTLWGKGSLGTTASTTLHVKAGKTPVNNKKGSFAWAVLDEGTKARINTGYIAETNNTSEKIMELGSGVRPAVEFIPGLGALKRKLFSQDSVDFASIQKGISASNYALAGESLASGTAEKLKPLLHDVTTNSVGIFTDTAQGGLRKDFNLLTNGNSLPAEYASKGIYESILGLSNSDAPSDPRWNSFYDFSRIYSNKISIDGGSPTIQAQGPVGWAASGIDANGSTTANKTPPPGLLVMPTVAKVQMIFSLIGRDIYSYPAYSPGSTPPRVPDNAGNMHGPQDGHFRGTKYKYDLHLLYTPVITLHNPYNVALKFSSLKVNFQNVPFAMQVFRNGQAQSRGLVPLDTMYGDNSDGRKSKSFGMTLKTKVNEKPGSANFTMLPGEVKLFSPYIDPNRNYKTDLGDRKFWDIYVSTGITSNIDAMPGWRGDGIGFDCDWLAGNLRVDGTATNGRWASCLGLAWDDEIHVEFAPLSTPLSKNKFVVTLNAQAVGGTGAGSSAIEMDYESADGLQTSLLGRNKTIRYPDKGAIQGHQLVDHSTTRIGAITGVKPFAMISAQAKTTFGGSDPSGKDGRIASKPYAFAHANIGAVSEKLVTESTASHSHSIDFQRLEQGRGTTEVIPVDPNGRGTFITGHSTFTGKKFGVLNELPIAPIQTLTSLNGANPGGASAFLPRFASPIGNSWAHPLISPDKIQVSGVGGIPYLDHSFFLNTALFDGFYFSGFADQTGPSGSGVSASKLAEDFSGGKPLRDPRLTIHNPDGRSFTELAAVVSDTNGYQKIAGWQTMKGAFNINSTSIPAWKAMLGSIHDENSVMNLVDQLNNTSAIKALTPVGTGKARISRFRLPASDSASAGGDPASTYWLGPREFDEDQLQTLAEKIVSQIQQRGPFLSLAEFVNRQTGTGNLAQRGALQQAIDDSGLNDAFATTAQAGYEITADKVEEYKYANKPAGAGPSYQGAPGYLTQADLLSVLGNAATARSDTFVVRGYGDAVDKGGNILASAICEAVVQRTPEWIDPANAVETLPAALSPANAKFGRRFQIISFRWLKPEEI